MSRLIDADKLIEQMRDMYNRSNEIVYKRAIADISARMVTAEVSRWIPVAERLPETEDKVLCQTVTKKGVVNFVIGYYTKKLGWVCGMNSNVLAWMPLPEPYREEKV